MLPTLTMQAIEDPTAFVSLEEDYHDRVHAAGNGDLLVQTFTREDGHSKLSTPQYAALFAAMLDWVETGVAPTPGDVAARCETAKPRYAGEGCWFEVGDATGGRASGG